MTPMVDLNHRWQAWQQTPVRQSTIAKFNDCPLSAKFDLDMALRQSPGAMGVAGARGVLAHRMFAAFEEHMVAHGETEIPIEVAMPIAMAILAQRDVPDEDVVLLPLREIPWLRVLITRWTSYNRFSIDRIVGIEHRLTATISCVGPGGEVYEREVTGKPDLLLAGPGADEATLVDWKTGWAPPAKRREPTVGDPSPTDKLSDMGYVQQVVYGWLVMREYPAIQRVTEREVYVMANDDPVREATVERWETERIEDALAAIVSQMDAAIEGGPDSKRWFPVPGTHCGFCTGRRLCPIRNHFGIPDSLEEAQTLAREWHVAQEIRTERTPYLKGWIDANGAVPIAHAKGRRVVGYKNGSRSLSLFEPEDAPASPFDPLLEAAAREAGVLNDE